MNKIVQFTLDLPADPGTALVEFSRRVERALATHKKWTDDDLLAVFLFFERFLKKYKIGTVYSFAKDMKLRTKVEYYVSDIKKNRGTILTDAVGAEVDNVLQAYVDQRENNTFGLAKLNPDEKTKILEHLERIRILIEKSKLPDRKKNALFERITALIREVQTHGTRTDRFFSFAGDIGFVLGDMAKNAKPLITEIKEVLRIVGRSRARQEGISLPPGDEVLRIPSPDEEV